MIGALLWSTVAQAHRPGLSSARVTDTDVTLTLAPQEWSALDGLSISLAVDGAACAVGAATVSHARDGVTVQLPVSCPPGAELVYTPGFLDALPDGHRHTVEAGGQTVAILDAGHPTAALKAQPTSSVEVATTFVGLGVEHILIGYDHLAFLLALLLVARKGREMLSIVTGFTVAHSVTLTVAALGLLTPPDWIVEAAIAASIAYAGLENLWRPSPRRRFWLTCGLGLIHGFGFASVLQQLGLPRGDVLVALVSFNGGVELGQLGLVLLTLPLLSLATRSDRWQRLAVPTLSLAIAALGVWWTFERLSG